MEEKYITLYIATLKIDIVQSIISNRWQINKGAEEKYITLYIATLEIDIVKLI